METIRPGVHPAPISRVMQGKMFFMYGVVALANYAVAILNNRYFQGKPLSVITSRERVNIRSNRPSSLIGSSRANERIWDCYVKTQRANRENDEKR